MTPPGAADAGTMLTVPRAGRRRVLVSLCVSEITSWGVLYYAFPVLSGRIEDATGWSAPALAGAFSAALVVAGVLGIGVGRWLDRHGPRWLMTFGSLLAVLAVVAIALSPTFPVFMAAWLAAGVAMSAVLYAPAFTALTRWYGARALPALTTLTLAAGFASTIFAPLTAALVAELGWRGTYLVLAAVLAVVTLPAHWWGLRLPWPAAVSTSDLTTPAGVSRSPAFLALVAAFALASCASYAVVVNLVPLLHERGISAGIAAAALGLGGAAQVLGRLGYSSLSRRLAVRVRTVVVLAGVAATTALLASLASLSGLVGAAVLAGAARGVMTLLQATAVTDRWGAAHYGQLTGLLSAPVTLAAALAPWVGAVLAAGLGGYRPMFWVLALLAAAGAGLGALSVPAVSRS